jgi:hypothetical protein
MHAAPTNHKSCTLRLVGVGAAIALCAACGGGTTATQESKPRYAASIVQPAVLHAGEVVPLPKKPILTVRGKITTTNASKTLKLDARSLDTMGVLKVKLYDATVKKQLTFEGMWLADVLKIAGIEKTAKSVHFTALDDYQSDLTVTEIDKGGIFLATKTGNGSPIAIATGGPTRLVFMDNVKAGNVEDAWIWSIKTLDVK